ncbi:MAG: pyridoxamine kinase [Clostridia bacterium]|nr:pyridoxamine kinase [Clostridia bacterium]
MRRILTIQDISCVGRCSLTVALPIISAAGVECSVLPTAVLSTHTAFPSYTFHDLTEELDPIADTFRDLHLNFDAIYTGYLGSFSQLDFVDRLLSRLPNHPTVIIDPVMGDHGKLYAGFTPEFAEKMATLCRHADLLLPNMTEAAYLLNEPYREDYDETYLQQILKKLTSLGAKRVALTGISLKPDEIGYYFYDAVKEDFSYYSNEKLPVVFHGTGDIFASAVTGAYIRGMSFPDALSLAVDFTLASARATMLDPDARDYGVNFEEALPLLIERLQKGLYYARTDNESTGA